MKQAVDRLAAQEASKIQPPRFVYALVLEPCLNLLKGAPFGGEGDSHIFADFQAKLAKAGLSETERAEFIARGTGEPAGGLATGYRRLIAHFRAAAATALAAEGGWKPPH